MVLSIAIWSGSSRVFESPFGYTTSVSKPSGSSHTMCERSGKRLTFISSDGQYRGPTIPSPFSPPSKCKKPRDSFITLSVSAFVRVAQQLTCFMGGTHALSWRNPNGRGGSSPGCSSSPA